MPAASRRIILAANSSWNIVNFRAGLIHALRDAGYEPIVVAPIDPPGEARLAELGVERVVVDIDRAGLNPLADFALLRKYRQIFKELGPAAFLGFTIKPNIYGCLAAGQLGIPAIANVSGLGTVFIKQGALLALIARLYRFAFRRADVVFFQNPDDRAEFLGRRLVRIDQARLLPGSGVDLDHFRASPLPAGRTTFLLIGRLLGDKGVREYAAAARRLRELRPELRFQLLGPLDDGNRTAIARAELEAWVKQGAIEYLGETADVRPFVDQATAVVLPSYREGLPRSLLEAAAMGRPLIATDVPGCREPVEARVNGFLCQARDPESLGAAMLALADLPRNALEAMGAASRAMAEDRFGEAVVISAYLDALGKLTASPS